MERIRLEWLILLSGGIGALLAAWGPPIALWVALSAAFTSAFIGWQELRRLDSVVRNYSKVIMELDILSNHWKNLEVEEQTQTEFYRVVRSTENVLWSQNVQYINAMQEAMRKSDLEEEASLINRVIQEQRASDLHLKQAMTDAVVDYTKTTMEEGEEIIKETFTDTLGSLTEEASSEVVQAELAAIQQSISDAVESMTDRMGINLESKLRAVQEEYDGVEISGNTPPGVLNEIISRYPKTTDTKG